MPTTRPILVTGATGQQGGATARHLLTHGWPVRALVRDPTTPAAHALHNAGAELHPGDLAHPATLDTALDSTHGLFAITPADVDPNHETHLGTTLIDAAARANLNHVVLASVGAANRDTGLPFWDSKWRIEQHLRASGLPHTILRPVRFMENHATPTPVGGIHNGHLRHVFAPTTPVQLIAVDDIGAFATLAFTNPTHYLGQAIELAGDELTSTQITALISTAVGRTVTYRQWLPDEPSGMGTDIDRAHTPIFALAATLTDQRGLWHADIPALRARHPDLLDFATWLRTGGANRIAQILP